METVYRPLLLVRAFLLLVVVSSTLTWALGRESLTRRMSLLSGDDGMAMSKVVRDLVAGPLSSHQLLLVTDDEAENLLDVGWILASLGPLAPPSVFSTSNSLLHIHYPTSHIRGPLLATIFVFHNDPNTFLDLLQTNQEWNPKYLVLFCLNDDVNTTRVISQPLVQRSERILMLQMVTVNEKLSFKTYTSLPMQVNSRGKKLVKTPLGTWRPERPTTLESIFPSRFDSFGGIILQLSSWCDDTPFLYYKDGQCTGENIDALTIISHKYNFTFYVQDKPADERWDSKENGSWVGLMAGLMYEGKHLAPNAMLLNEENRREFDYTYPYQTEGFSFLHRMPPPLPQWKNLLYPFTTTMWVAVLASTMLVVILLVFLLHVVQHLHDPISFALKVVAGLLHQSVDMREVRASWARVWLAWWWVVMMLDYGNFVPGALKTSSHPALAALGHKLELMPYDSDAMYDHIFQRMEAGGYAFLEFSSYLFYLQKHYNFTAVSYIMNSQIYSSLLVWFLPRNTPYTPLFSHALMHLREAGILSHLFSQHLRTTIKRQDKNKAASGGGQLKVKQLQGAFILWVLGLTAAALTLLLEFLIRYY
ncbi:Glutamate receptor ionotropic, delta-1-like 6, partial [Homarus americanus]